MVVAGLVPRNQCQQLPTVIAGRTTADRGGLGAHLTVHDGEDVLVGRVEHLSNALERNFRLTAEILRISERLEQVLRSNDGPSTVGVHRCSIG